MQFHLKKNNQEIMAAAYASERPLFLDSYLNPQLINKSGFKSREAYDSMSTEVTFTSISNLV